MYSFLEIAPDIRTSFQNLSSYYQIRQTVIPLFLTTVHGDPKYTYVIKQSWLYASNFSNVARLQLRLWTKTWYKITDHVTMQTQNGEQ